MDAARPTMAETLTTGDLTLRVFSLADLEELHSIFSDPATHTIGNGPVKNIQETADWLRRRDEFRRQHGVAWYAVRREADGVLVGSAGLSIRRTAPHPEFGFEIRHADQGRGYGGAAATAVIAEAYRAGFPEVWATVRERNVASLRTLARIGFERDRIEPDLRGPLVYLLHRAS